MSSMTRGFRSWRAPDAERLRLWMNTVLRRGDAN
jgi:hypothetical protein